MNARLPAFRTTAAALTLLAALLAAILSGGCGSRVQGARSTEMGSESVIGRWATSTPAVPLPGRAFRPGDLPASPPPELWIIQKPARPPVAASPTDDLPGSGSLVVKSDDPAAAIVPVPVEHTAVSAAILGPLATVDVVQKFHNPFSHTIEAVYVFPLPEEGAVSEFVMTVGERRIRGVVREREEAQRLYREARSAGHAASLMTQERPNIFAQSVANIEPGRGIDVSIRYFHTVAYDDGWFEFVFPMVVGPRFNPTHISVGVGAVPRGGAGLSGQPTEVQYLRPDERSGHDISLTLTLDAGVPVEEVLCRTHRIDVARPTPASAAVTLSSEDRIPNRDFVLRYRPASGVQSMIAAHRPALPIGAEGHFLLMLLPPPELDASERRPVEMIFVLDCSGSMRGEPLAQAKAAIRHALNRLTPRDTFQVVRFSDTASAMGDRTLPATPENVHQAVAHVDGLHSEGGTMMIHGIRAALGFPRDRRDAEPRDRIIVFLTDGYIGNEAEILAEVRRRLGDARIFSFGVGSSVNRYLLDSLARVGNGAAAYLGLRDDAADVMDRFLRRAATPALTDVSINWGSMAVHDVHPGSGLPGDDVPAYLPDLFPGRPLILAGRFTGEPPAAVTLRARRAGRPVEIPVPVRRAEEMAPAAAAVPIAKLWARKRIADLSERAAGSAPSPFAVAEIHRLALAHGLLSQTTAFVAVDAATVAESGPARTTVAHPVPVPEGVRYETTVQDPAAAHLPPS